MNFACERCAQRYSLPDEKVPPSGVRARCTKCGHVFVVGPPAPPPVPAPPAPAPRPPAPPVDEHDRFFSSAPASGELSLSDEWVVSARNRRPGVVPAVVLGVFVAVGLVAAGAWKAGRQAADDAAAGTRERRPGWVEGQPDQPDQPGRPRRAAATVLPPTGPAELPAEAPLQQRGGPAGVAGGLVQAGPGPSPEPSRRGGEGAGKRNRKLLDLLDRKEDAALGSVPPAGGLSTGRVSLDEATLRGALSANSSAFSACIGRAAKADPALRLQARPVVLELVVEPSGRVARATVEDPRYASTPLGACFVAAARRMVFPSFEGEEILVQAPLKLSAVQ